MNKGKIVCRTIRAVLSCAGVCASVCIGINLLFSVFAAASTVVLAGLLDALGNNAGGPAGKGVLLYAAAFLGLQAVRRLLGVVSEVAWNVGVDEKCRYHF